ncbi:fibronectin type III domain-containing protein [Hymenobacter sp. ASUV-10]|uniref:Fibronectin type III domain-containing protein n=1 Tax=Hymenobacter aranciens TaxID=3063996 RepID=A0ABT9B550_9BACT|nr:fibronectin type III domain-containing protein [Hymenobacter sp. ASUV-10]MDO7873391.1 fibronectin type III domain-containing protein [Hymenobacter sp. ASUV-10]
MTKLLRTGSNSPHLLMLLFFLLLGPLGARAQVSNYTFAASSGTYVPVSSNATPVAILADDIISGQLPIGFSFVFDGATYTQLKASSNGFLSFNPSALNNLTNNLSTGAATEKPLVAPLWDDLDGRPTDATAFAGYEVTGTAPSRVFTFEWRNWEWFYNGNLSVITFQAKLYEGSNRIEFIYHPETNAPSSGASASIGIASGGTTGCAADFLSLSDASTSPTASSSTETRSINVRPADGQVYAFSPPPPTTGTCAAVRCANVGNITGVSAQLNFNGSSASTSYTVTYQANGGPVQTVSPAPTTSPVTLTGLSLNTTYTATITANCATGASTPVTLTFATSNGYCVSGVGGVTLGGVCGGNNITSVAISGTTLNATGLTCNTPVAGTAYTNYPATGPTTGTVLRGITYPVTVNTSGNSILSVWIDSNHDLAFTADEWVQVATTTTAGTAVTANITIPLGAAGAYTGPTGMRVRSRANGNPNGSGDACTQFFSGETKDFTINIGAAPACPPASVLTATAVTATSATLGFTSPGAGTYTIVYGLQGFNPALAPTSNQMVLAAGATSTSITGLQSGSAYQFYVLRDCGGTAGPSIYAGPTSFTTVIGNDDPCGATTLSLSSSGCVPLATTLLGATTTIPSGYTNPGTGCGPNNVPRDVWYKFTTDASGPGSTSVRISVTGGPASAVQLFSASSCLGPFTLIRCVGTAANTAAPALDWSTLTPNTTYYVRVFNYTSASTLGNFTICATPLPSCPTPSALAAQNVTKSSALLSWTAGTGGVPSGSSYSVILGPPGFNPNTAGTTITGITTPNYQLTSLTPQTNYCFYVRLICGGLNGNSTLVGPTCFQTRLESPTNDDPCGADPLPLTNVPVAGNNTGSSTSLQPGIDTSLPACGVATAPRDVWYILTGAAAPNNAIVFNVTDPAAGLVRVYESTDCASGPFRLVFCRAAGASNVGFSAPFTMPDVVPGRTYYVAVSGYGSSDANGAFTIAAQPLFIAPPCNPVTNLTVANVTGTTAEVSFTPGLNNTSYSITYTAAGGTPVTITATASPVTLTGLLGLTSYSVSVLPLCTSGGTSTATTTSFTTLVAPCGVATNLAASNITDTSADISFTPGVNNTSYVVTYTAAGGSPVTVTPAPAGSPFSLSGLLAGTVYTVSITPTCASGGTSSAATFTFATTAPPCDPVTNLTSSNVTSTSANISFTPGASNASYVVTYTPFGGAPVTVTPAISGSPFTLTGLASTTQYTVTVTPTCTNTGIGTTVSTTFSTPAPPICNAVTNILVGNLTTTSAEIAFTPGTNNTSFEITYTPAGGQPTTVTTGGSPYILTNLTPGVVYTVVITPTCSAGGTAGPAQATFTTVAVCDGVTALAVGSITTTSASVSFTPGTNNTAYTVTYTAVGVPPVTVTPTPTASPVVLSNLTPGTAYTVTVTPTCASGTAPTSSVTFSTISPCEGVTGLSVASITATSATVNFTPGANNTSYTVTYAAAGSPPVTVTPNPGAAPVILTGLTPNTAYTVTVTPNCASGPAPTSSTTFNTILGARNAVGMAHLSVFPNPAHTAFSVSIPAVSGAQKATVELVNSVGQIIRTQAVGLNTDGAQTTMDVTGLATGLYMVRVQAGAATATVRLMVE